MPAKIIEKQSLVVYYGTDAYSTKAMQHIKNGKLHKYFLITEHLTKNPELVIIKDIDKYKGRFALEQVEIFNQ